MLNHRLNFSSEQRVEQLPPDIRLRLEGLTQREAQVALLAARGYLGRQIAQQANVSVGTVKTQLKRARDKLGCRTVRQLTAVLLREGLVKTEELLTSDQDDSLASPTLG